MALVVSGNRIAAATSSNTFRGRDLSPNNPATFRDGDARWLSADQVTAQPKLKFWDCTSWTIWELINAQPSVGACLDYFAQTVSMLGSAFYGFDEQDCKFRLPDSDELQQINEEPSPGMTRQEWAATMIYDYAGFSNAFAMKWRAEDNDRLWLLPLPAELITPGDDQGLLAPSFYWLGHGENRLRIDAEDMLHIARPPARSGWGKSVLASLVDVLSELAASTEYRRNNYEKGLQPGGFIEAGEAYKGSYKKLLRLREQIQNHHGGASSAGKIIMLEKGLTFKPAQVDSQSLDYLNVRKLTKAEVRERFLIPDSSSAGSGDGAAYASKKADSELITTDVIAPMVEMFDAQLTMEMRKCFPGRRFARVTSWEAKLRPDPKAEADIAKIAVGVHWLTVNEQREKEGLKPVEGGDRIARPLNYGYLGDEVEALPAQRAMQQVELVRKTYPGSFVVKAITRGDEADEHADLLRSHFERQKRAVIAALGRGDTGIFDRERFQRELADDLEELNAKTMATYWARWSRELDLDDGDVDWARAARIEADAASERVNESTEQRLGRALAEGDQKSAIEAVFDDERRSEASAKRTVSVIAGFTGEAAGVKAGLQWKRWIDTDGKSDRHPPTPDRVRLGERFSNGGLYPGDGDDTYGCDCILSIER